MALSEYPVRITNITSSFSVGRKLDFDDLRSKFGARLKPAKSHFPRLTWRMNKFGNTGMIYQSGKVVIVGSRSHLAAEEAAEFLYNKLDGVGGYNVFHSNIAGTTDFKHFINLTQFFTYLRTQNDGRYFGNYETERFPAMFYECKLTAPNTKNVKATIFRTGKVIYSGATNIDALNDANKEMYVNLIGLSNYGDFELAF